jgi:predicted PurR-regulated permease PerM
LRIKNGGFNPQSAIDNPQSPSCYTPRAEAHVSDPTPTQDPGPATENAFLARHPFVAGYAFVTALAVLVFTTHLETFFLSFLFLYLISDVLTNDVRKLVPFVPKAALFSLLYVAVIALVWAISARGVPYLLRALPGLTADLQTRAVEQFQAIEERWRLSGYVDPKKLVDYLVSGTTGAARFLAREFSNVYKGALYFVFALILNLLLYHDTTKVDAVFARRPASLGGFLYRFTASRLRLFYFYFRRVMGGQILISAVNTVISAVVVFALALPHPVLLIGTIFVCGLFPIVGNLVSNSILTLTALVAVGGWAALVCLGLLVAIHKLEYFLNSRIIGGIVHLPMVVTLGALIVCEVLLGIVGLILAIPLLLFVRHELEAVPGLVRGPVEAEVPTRT